MQRFKTTIRKARFVEQGFSAQQMQSIGQQFIDTAERPRIRAGLTVYDQPAPPLSIGYAKRKTRRGLQPIRDWSLTGRTLRSMKVLTAGPNQARIGFTDAEANKRAAINNRRARQFGVSPADHTKLIQITLNTGKPVIAKQVA